MSAQPLTLTAKELVEVTGYKRAAEQLRWLLALGIPAQRRADGTVSVAREHYLRIGELPDKIFAQHTPDWSALATQAKD
ncbi:MAG TPA: DUF4224 domain-containing protein [Burkholderiales bacterium]|nr:DUF4224 domain-containing protein [Burkholderiales bacterium]